MKKENYLLDKIKEISDIFYQYLTKFIQFVRTKEGKNLLKIIVRLVVLIVLIFLSKIVFYLFTELGRGIILITAGTFKTLLTGIWEVILNLSFTIFSLILIHLSLKDLYQDKELTQISKNSKFQKKFINILKTSSTIFKVLTYISLVPSLAVGVLLLIGVLFYFLFSGVYLISLLTLVISLLVFIVSLFFFIRAYLNNQSNRKRKINLIITITLAVFLLSLVFFAFETRNYSFNESLTDDFTFIESQSSYKLDTNDYLKIKVEADRNLKIVQDTSLENEVLIKTDRAETSNLLIENKIKKDTLNIEIYYDLDLKFKDLAKLNKLVIRCLEDKTIYNYQLIQYGKTTVYVHPDNLDKVIIESN